MSDFSTRRAPDRHGPGSPAPARHHATLRALHWLVVLAVLVLIPVGFLMIQDGLSRPLQDTLFILHKNLGPVVFVLMLIRLVHRLRHPTPPLPPLPRWQHLAAEANHVALYVLLFVMPISGYLRVRAGGFPIEGLDALGIPTIVPRSDSLEDLAQAVHFYGAWALLCLIAVHVGAALYHGLVRRDGVVARIWPPMGASR
ncbi:cytochrome b [Citreimonas sp.]|uniref:cytochrome b n=1 Tax=Citreimonas sp. TaxID=3036715 RepID=UPI0035C85102